MVGAEPVVWVGDGARLGAARGGRGSGAISDAGRYEGWVVGAAAIQRPSGGGAIRDCGP